MAGILEDIDKSIRATARTITRTKLTDKIRSEVVLQKAGLRSLTEAVSTTMASAIWKARQEMSPLGLIFQKRPSVKNTRSAHKYDILCQPVPGHPEAAANRLAHTWNEMNLQNAKSLNNAKSIAKKWYNQNSKSL